MLKDKGKLYIIHRTDRMIELINLLTKYKFGIKRLQIIYPTEHSNGSMIIIEAKKIANMMSKFCHLYLQTSNRRKYEINSRTGQSRKRI